MPAQQALEPTDVVDVRVRDEDGTDVAEAVADAAEVRFEARDVCGVPGVDEGEIGAVAYEHPVDVGAAPHPHTVGDLFHDNPRGARCVTPIGRA